MFVRPYITVLDQVGSTDLAPLGGSSVPLLLFSNWKKQGVKEEEKQPGTRRSAWMETVETVAAFQFTDSTNCDDGSGGRSRRLNDIISCLKHIQSGLSQPCPQPKPGQRPGLAS